MGKLCLYLYMMPDRRTASKYLRTLERLGILTAEQKWKETLFINTRLFDLLRG